MDAEIIDLKLPGCKLIQSKKHTDTRGVFQKIYNDSFFIKNNMRIKIMEQYYSISKKNVLRGMHFQLPEMDLEKVVYCICGEIMDVIVDLRVGSPTYGEHDIINLNSKDGEIVFLPKGIAHGFYSLNDDSIVVYNVSAEYSRQHDFGILWSSLDIDWPGEPVVSERDLSFPKLSDFRSPFVFSETI